MLVRETSIGNCNKRDTYVYLNNINILSLLTTCRLWALILCNLCALYTEHFQNKQLGIIRYLKPKSAQCENFFSTNVLK